MIIVTQYLSEKLLLKLIDRRELPHQTRRKLLYLNRKTHLV